MTIAEISKFAQVLIFTYQRTLITLKSGEQITGNFDKNILDSSKKINKWNFVKIL